MKHPAIGLEVLRLLMLGWDQCVVKPFVRIWPKKSGIKVLCFGDSNTWGSRPGSGLRYPFRSRWPGVVQAELGQGFVIIEEGRNGRTTDLDDPGQRGCNGRRALEQCLRVHRPLDLVIIVLGTNDLKTSFDRRAEHIAQSMKTLGQMVLASCLPSRGTAPLLMLVAPPAVKGDVHRSGLFHGADTKSAVLADHYRVVAGQLGCEWFDAGTVIQSSLVDGVHWEQEAHETLGKALAQHVRCMFVQTEQAS
ncbi:MAG: hydrolase [Nitrospirales bacterium]|nr:MAG: hydrolase [Nitrospirales bacterium]